MISGVILIVRPLSERSISDSGFSYLYFAA